jgi:hypothetical protein
MMGIFGGCPDELCKVMNCYTVSFFKTGHSYIFQPAVNFCPHENIQPSFVVKLWDIIIIIIIIIINIFPTGSTQLQETTCCTTRLQANK